MAVRILVLGLFVSGACERTGQADVREHTAPTTPNAVAASASDTGASVPRGGADLSAWYHRTRELDVTGDGRVDTLVLRAVGPTVDSLKITFSVVVSGDTALLADWESSYQLIDPPEKAVGPGRDSYVRDALDSTLAGVKVESFSDSTLGRPWIPHSSDEDCESNIHDCIVKAVRAELAPKGWTREQISAAPFDTTARASSRRGHQAERHQGNDSDIRLRDRSLVRVGVLSRRSSTRCSRAASLAPWDPALRGSAAPTVEHSATRYRGCRGAHCGHDAVRGTPVRVRVERARLEQ